MLGFSHSYDDLDTLKALTEEDLKALVEATAMKQGHVVKFRQALASLRAADASTTGAAAEDSTPQDPRQVLGTLMDEFEILEVVSNKKYTVLFKSAEKSRSKKQGKKQRKQQTQTLFGFVRLSIARQQRYPVSLTY